MLARVFDHCSIRNRHFQPARFCAPLAGYTHSAFRRLLAELGGCGALWTEMLAARQVLSEDFAISPWVRRRPEEGVVFYQLMLNPRDPVERILDRLGEQGVEALDLNMACNAKVARANGAGSALFRNADGLRLLLKLCRGRWPGLLTAKIRLGSEEPGWQALFQERLKLLQDSGIDAIILHPRFFEDKFKKRARLELIDWASSAVSVPLIANGDMTSAQHVHAQAAHLRNAAGIMIGRMAVVQPWIFARWNDRLEAAGLPVASAPPVDYWEIWGKMFAYIVEDFPMPTALRRLQMFTKYYADNFLFGHQFAVDVGNANTLDEASHKAQLFLEGNPEVLAEPRVSGW